MKINVARFEELCRLIEIEREAYNKAITEKDQEDDVKIIYLRLKELEKVSEILVQNILS